VWVPRCFGRSVQSTALRGASTEESGQGLAGLGAEWPTVNRIG
jgi:hypothetical protein